MSARRKSNNQQLSGQQPPSALESAVRLAELLAGIWAVVALLLWGMAVFQSASLGVDAEKVAHLRWLWLVIILVCIIVAILKNRDSSME